MKWGELTEEHNGKKAKVFTNEPGTALRSRGPFTGIIDCKGKEYIPLLLVPGGVMYFSDWYEVELKET